MACTPIGTAMQGIVDAIETILTAAVDEGVSVIVGPKTDKETVPPMVWVVPGKAVATRAGGMSRDEMEWPISFVGVVHNYKTAEGYAASVALACDAVETFVKNKTNNRLGLDYVSGCLLDGIDMFSAYSTEGGYPVEYSEATMIVRFRLCQN